MTLGEHYFVAHPRLAFAVHGLTAVALGWISNLVQQHWFLESYLLLHIAGWWVVSVLWLLHLANRPHPQPEQAIRHFASDVRLHALLFGDTPSFHDTKAEQDEDYPTGTPLFRTICLGIREWRLSSLTVSPETGEQRAVFTGRGNARVTLSFDNWDSARYIGVTEFHASEEQLRSFLGLLNTSLSEINDLTKIRWYAGDPGVFHAQMSDADLEAGADSPFIPHDRDA